MFVCIPLICGASNLQSTVKGDQPHSCPNCDHTSTLFHLSQREWFTFFFLPIIPLGSKKRFWRCVNCMYTYNGEQPPQVITNTKISNSGPSMFPCSQCGENIQIGSKFCSNCGYHV